MTTTALVGGIIVDGTGAPGFPGDVLIDGETIARIVPPGELAGGDWDETIDITGRTLTPGFIDMHAHSDLAVLADPEHLGKVSQGVTTEVVGQDGLGYAPTTDETMAIVREQIAAWNGTPDLDYSWRSIGDYLDRIDETGAAVNVAVLVPQGMLRMNVIGNDDRPATPDEIAEMRRQLARGLEEGAFGLSAGLSYVPGMYADAAELVEVCRELDSEAREFFAPHQRSYGKGALEGYAEMIDIARRSGAGLHLTHATMNFGVNRGRAAEFLELIDAAIAEGIDISLDTYPYLPGSTTLAALLPSWAGAGGPAKLLERLSDRGTRAQIAHEMNVVGTDGCHGVRVEWETIEISGVRDEALSSLVGRTLDVVAQTPGELPEEIRRLLAEDGQDSSSGTVDPGLLSLAIMRADRLGTGILQHVGHEENVRAIMRHPVHCGGSDGLLVGAKPHPRAWGTFPRYLGHYVRELGVLDFADCIAHLTSRPAARLGLDDRGRIAPGCAADLVVLDPDTVADASTFASPRRQALGIDFVFVRGTPVIADGTRTSHTPGRALRHDRKKN